MELKPILDGPGKPPYKRWWIAATVIWVLLIALGTMILEDMYPGSRWVTYVPAIGVIILISAGVIAWARHGDA